MKPPARAIVGNLVWSTDGGVWAVWRVEPFAHAHTAVADKLGVHSQLRGLLMSMPTESMLLSICERLSPLDVVERMAEGINLQRRQAWAVACEASHDWLSTIALRRRRYYVAAQLPEEGSSWLKALTGAASDVGAAFGLAPRPLSPREIEERRRQAQSIQMQIAQHVRLEAVTAGELCWLYARSFRRGDDEPTFDERWEPPADGEVRAGKDLEDAEQRRPRGVLAHLTDVVIKEGGYSEDQGRPRHRRYVRIDSQRGATYQTAMALADMPHFFRYPGGGGEWLYHVDQVGFPVDWCVRIKALANSDAQSKVRRKHRDLIGQIDEYDGEVTGAPPQLAEAIRSISAERDELGANPAEAELQVTVVLSLSSSSLATLEDQAGAITAMFQPEEYALARPTGGQVGLLRSMLPGTATAQVCRDYTQFLLSRDLAAGAPFCGADVGDPRGLLLGVSLDGGNASPVLFDPAYGPQVNASPSLAAVGRLGSGKSFFLKRLCWDSVARGGQVVTIDRTRSGEYVALGEAMPGRTQVVRLEAGADTRMDPLRTFTGDQRTTVTLGFLSLLAGCSAHSEEGAALAEAVDAVVGAPDASLKMVVETLVHMGADDAHPDQAARGLARRLAHYATSPVGQLAFGEGEPVSLDADFIVFWAPNLALADRETLASEQSARLMLPEQVLGQALLYLVAAVGRQVVFRDPTRFAAALYDEAWALLASPHGQNLLVEGVRDGRKHNGAIWLASQHPNDLSLSELQDLLGSRFVFRQARQAIPAALQFLGVEDSAAAAATLEGGLDTGVCLYRDVRDRVGLIQVLPPALPELDEAFNTAPASVDDSDAALEPVVVGELEAGDENEDVDADFVDEDFDVETVDDDLDDDEFEREFADELATLGDAAGAGSDDLEDFDDEDLDLDLDAFDDELDDLDLDDLDDGLDDLDDGLDDLDDDLGIDDDLGLDDDLGAGEPEVQPVGGNGSSRSAPVPAPGLPAPSTDDAAAARARARKRRARTPLAQALGESDQG